MTPKFLTLTAIVLISISCKKENIAIDSNGEILRKITINNPSCNQTSIINYLYNSQGQLTEIRSTNNQDSSYLGRQLFVYTITGQLLSCLVTDNRDGDHYRFDFQADSNGRIVKGNCTALRNNLYVQNVIFKYDAKGRLSSDSLYLPTGKLDSYRMITYDNSDNVLTYQHFIITSNSNYALNKYTSIYDNKKSPYAKLGLLLYTALAGSGDSYFYLSKNNATTAYLNDTVLTPGGYFIYQYYQNGLVHKRKANIENPLEFEYFYE